MARVFISHSSRDNVSAKSRKDWLEKKNFEVPFLDFDKHAGIPPGADWEKTLHREIRRSDALLILLSANWIDSKWCFAEFTLARALGKEVFQVIESDSPWPWPSADGNPGPIPAANLQCLDLRQEREAGLEQLEKELKKIAIKSQQGFHWDQNRPIYPGLFCFDEQDAAIYFGRDRETIELCAKLNASIRDDDRLVVLAGPSGSGKSSLLRAGVLPRLRRAGGDWLVVPPFRPQSDPCQQLAQALALAAGRGTDWNDWYKKLQDGDSSKDSEELPRVLKEIAGDLRMSANLNEAQILLSIDQGEELFGGLAREEVERFFRIVSVAMGDDVPFLAVMTLRSEFLGRLQAEAKKNSLTARFQVQSLGPMPAERIPEIIEGPAELAGLQVEKDFVNEVIKDAETEDALPLLADALRELYENYHLTLPEYEALGDKTNGLSPLENIVCKRADDVLKKAQPPDEEKEALRDALLKMVRIEEGNYVRQAAGSDKLPPKAKPDQQGSSASPDKNPSRA